ncbi:hypothetical protein DYQ86_27355 [Acidobacteria bacterium AB60]|nr:hypothetical protein DYQ86_27355 [Acidobacteria bacterium AB60]
MKTWQKILIPFVITLVVGGIYLFVVFKRRQEPGVNKQQSQQLTADQVAVVRLEFPQHYEDVKELEGKSVWMKSGYSMPYFPYVGGRVQFAKPVALIPPDQPLDVKKAIKAVAPAGIHDNIEHGDHQVLVVFALPDSKDLYATPVGFTSGPIEEHYYDDMLFYYDDPHVVFSNWPKDVWQAIDAHQVKPGMSELQTRCAIGMKAQVDGQIEGSRTVDYDVNGKHIVVTYSHDKATAIQGQ